MSKHCIETKAADGREVTIQIGWDKPLREFYAVAEVKASASGNVCASEPESDDEAYLYSNLADMDLAPFGPKAPTLDYFVEKLKSLGVSLPDSVIVAVRKDGENNVVNRFVRYTPECHVVSYSANRT